MRNNIMRLKKEGKKGFTLVELIVVIAIIIVLMAIMIPLLSKYINDANDAKGLANARAVYSAAAAWASHELAVGNTIGNNSTLNATQLQPYFGNVEAGVSIAATVNSRGAVLSATYTQSGVTYTYPGQTISSTAP